MATQSEVFMSKQKSVNNEAQAHIVDLQAKRAVKVAEIAAIDLELDTWTKLSAEVVKRYPVVLEAAEVIARA